MKKLLLCASICLQTVLFAQTTAPLPAHGSQFTGNVRGYWFQSPSCFTITSLEVASEAGAGSQNIAVLRLPAPPPIFSATTNVFTTLFLTQNNPATGPIPCNIQIETGDYIMILGQRGTINSYSASGSWTTTINGIVTPIYRSGMQYTLTTTPPQELWSQASGSVSRVHMTYDSTINFTAAHTVLNQSDVLFVNNADTSFTSVWDYGDGSPLDVVDTVVHTYATAGTYLACNYITTSCGTDTICMLVTVCGSAVTSSNYSTSTLAATASFTNASANATTWLWDFGDGDTSTAMNPSHTYAASGTYYVCLTAYNGSCDTAMYCDSVTVCIPANAQFASVDMGGGNWSFSDASTENTGWWWDFGDGNVDSVQNPSHSYTVNGTYNVCLVAIGCSMDTLCTSITTCPEVLSAAFLSSDSATTAMFTNGSVSATSYLWDFGDASSDTSSDPTHVYANTGLYTVCLTAWNLCGDSTTFCDTVLLIITSDAGITAGSAITVFSNPLNESSVITVSTAYQGNFVFEMYDGGGKLVRVQNGMLNSPMTVSRGELAAGSYTYKVITAKEVAGTGTIIIQ